MSRKISAKKDQCSSGLSSRKKTKKKWSIALVGDLHFGSRYCKKEYIQDFYERAEASGCSRVLQVGDLLEGMYRHHTPRDLDGHGFDEQADIALEYLPKNLPTTYILGNHDEKFGETGQHPGRGLVNHFKVNGREDLECIGDRFAVKKVNGLKVALFHPSFGMAKSNGLGVNPVRLVPTSALEKFLVTTKDRDNPDIVAVGHWHQSAYFKYRGMHVFLCGTFQGPGGSFSNSLSTDPSVGSWIVHVEEDGKRKIIRPEWVGY